MITALQITVRVLLFIQDCRFVRSFLSYTPGTKGTDALVDCDAQRSKRWDDDDAIHR